MQGYLTSDEVCKMLGISRQTLWKLSKEGKLCPRRIGKNNEYLEKEVKIFINNYPPVWHTK